MSNEISTTSVVYWSGRIQQQSGQRKRIEIVIDVRPEGKQMMGDGRVLIAYAEPEQLAVQ